MGKLRANSEIISDKSKNPVTTSTYIKHGNQWLDDAVNNAIGAAASKADKTYVDSELTKKANKSDTDAALSSKADKSALEATNASVSANTSNIQELSTESTVLSARMDEFTKLKEGSTTGDAELADGRVGADGKTYDNIGGAIRGQVADLKSDLNEVDSRLSESIVDISDKIFDAENEMKYNYFNKNSVTGKTKYAVNNLNIPADDYTLSIAQITSTDTDDVTNNIEFIYEDNTSKYVIVDRGSDIKELVKLTKNVKSIVFYASSNEFKSSGDTFTYTSVKLYQNTKVKEAIDNAFVEIENVNGKITIYNDEVYINNIITGKYITKASGYEGIAVADANSICTDFVYVRSNTTVKITGCYITSNRSICGYGLNHNFVSVLSDGKEGTEVYIQIPNNVTFIRITGRKDNPISVEYDGFVPKYEMQEAFGSIATTNGYMITGAEGYEGRGSTNPSSASTDFIRVMPNTVIEIQGCYITGNRSICAYDFNKKCVSVLAMGEDYTTLNVSIPNNARYIRITTHLDGNPVLTYLSKVSNEVLSPKHQNNASLFDTAALKPVLTFVDDDTWSIQYVTRQKNLCDTLGIKCTFSCLTSQVEKEEGFAELLLSFEREGFPIVLHGYTQGDFYNTDTMSAEMEEDFVRGMQMMNKYGFSDYKAVWVTPFGSSRPDEQTLAIKWGFDGLLTSGRPNSAINNPYNMNSLSRYDIQRISLGSNSATQASDLVNSVDAIKLAIDKASECNGWVCVSTHSAYVVYRNGEADSAMSEIVTYARNKGFDIRTINEELRRRMPIYKYYEKY